VLPRNPGAPIRQLGFPLLLLACLTGRILLSAPQQPAPTAAETSTSAPSLRVTTHLVQVNVIVNDKHGNPITGLTQKDFSLLDNGKRQEVRAFSAETNVASPPSRPPLPPDTYTNRPEEQTNIPASVTVILLDALNTEFADQALTRKQVLKFLEQLRPQDRVALYWLGDNLYVLNDFTTDVSSLRAALGRSKGESNRDLAESDVDYLTTNSPNPSLPAGVPAGHGSSRAAFRSAFDQRVANESTKDRVRLTVAALIAIAHHVGALGGRKNLVWVSGSFPFDLGNEKFDLDWANDTAGVSFSAQIKRAAQALTDADIAVYPVDARGLMGNGVTAVGDFSDPPPLEFSGEGNEHLPTRVAPGNLQTMKVLAERTGGKAFYGTNDISGAIRHAIDDSRVTYTLGYYPAAVKWDGSFHELKVKVAAPGAEVRARTGYFAFPEPPVANPENDRVLISQLAASQLPATSIGLHVQAQMPKVAGGSTLAVEVHIDLREIQMQQREGRWTGTVQSVFLQLDTAGKILQVDDRTFHPDFDGATYEQVLKSGISDDRQVHVARKATQLCVVVRDAANANTGSIYLSLAQYLPDSSKASPSK
jgi:VWFA-related protein